MARFDLYMGLNPTARKKVSITAREVGTRFMPDGSREEFDREVHLPRPGIIVHVIGEIKGRTTPEIPVGVLHRYVFPSGRVLEEYVQCTPCAGGHNFFIALRRPSGKVLKTTLWSHRETGLPERHNNYGADRNLAAGED